MREPFSLLRPGWRSIWSVATSASAVWVLLALAAAVVASEPADLRKPDRRYTHSYEIGGLLARMAPEPQAGQVPRQTSVGLGSRPGASSTATSVQEVVRLVMTTVHPDGWREGGSSLRVLNGTTLEIHATAEQHKEIEELLEALRRLHDVAVDIRGHLCEIDRSVYDKLIKPRLGNAQQGAGVPLVAQLENPVARQLRDKVRVVTANKVRIANGKEGEFLSLQNAGWTGTRPRTQGKDAAKPNPPPAEQRQAPDVQEQVQDLLNAIREGMLYPPPVSALGEPNGLLHGVTFRASVKVSADRRFVEMAMSQDVTNLLSVKEFPFGRDKVLVLPNLVSSSASATVRVADGQVLVLPVYYLPPSLKEKNRVYLLIVQPVIYIEAEEKELLKALPLP